MTESTKEALSGAAVIAILLGIVAFASKHWIEGVEVKAMSTESRLTDATLKVARFEERINSLEQSIRERFDHIEQLIKRGSKRD